MKQALWLFPLLLFFCACSEEEEKKVFEVYTGPTMKAFDIETRYSENAMVKVLVKAPIQSQFSDGNQEFPEGIEITHYDSLGKPVSKMTADYAKYVKEHDIYTGIGNVVIQNLQKDEVLKTEEINWSKPLERVYTDKFVHIKTAKEILKGHGLEAKDDFSQYRIVKPTAIISVEDNDQMEF